MVSGGPENGLEALRESEALYRLLAENSTDMISKHTPEGVYTYASPASRALLGYEPEELVGRLAYDYFHPDDLEEVDRSHSTILDGRNPYTVSYRIRRKDGGYTWFETTSRAVRDAATGEVQEIVAVSRDVTWQKQAEERLRESSNRITNILESTTDAFFALDHRQRFIFVNRRAEQLLRQTRKELLGNSVEHTFPRAASPRFYVGCRRAASGEEVHFEELYAPLGKWFEVQVHPYDEGLAVYFQDITERREGERQLREAEERFRSAFDNTPVGMAIVSPGGRYLQVNRAFCELLGYPEGKLLEKTYMDLTYHGDRRISRAYARRLEEGALDGYTLEKRYIHAGGHPVWVSLSVSLVRDPDGAPLYHVTQIQNIEERKQAETALREDAERLAEIISTQRAIAVAEPDQKSVLRLIVERSRELTGAAGAVVEMIEGEELVYQTASGKAQDNVGLRLNLYSSISGECVRKRQILRSDDVENDPRVDRTAARQTGARALIVVPLYHRQEIVGVLKVFSTETRAFCSRDVDTLQLMTGLIAAAMSHAAEFEAKQELLNERTASLARIQQSEARFRAIFEGATAGIAIVTLDGHLLQTNPALQTLLGYSEKELKNTNFTDITHPDDIEKDLRLYTELANGERTGYEIEKRYLHKDGSLLWGRLNVSLIYDSEGRPHFAVGIMEDITARKRAEEVLRKQAQQQAVVARIGQRALVETDLDHLIDEAVTLVSETLDTRFAKFLELLPEKDRLLLRAGSGWNKGYVGEAEVAAGTGSQAGYSLLSSGPVIAGDLGSESRFSTSRLQREHGAKSGMSVVVSGPERPFGVLGVDTANPRTFTEDDSNFLQAVANVLAAAIGRTHAEDALRRSGREYRRLFELANDAILIYEPESREILDVNENACEIYGYPRDTFVGMTMKELSLDRQKARRYLETLISRGSYQDFETVHRRRDGAPMNVLVNSSVIEFKGRRAVLSINRDITARKRTEASLLEIREAERRRIARDLHDAVLQDLAGALQGLQAFAIESDGDGVGLEQELAALRRATAGLRDAIYNLRKEKDEPFVRAVEALVEFNRQLTPERQITLSGAESFSVEFKREAGVELLRVLQEALANTRHHSRARRVQIRLCQREDGVRIEVYDDGRGFDAETVRGGVGLAGMRERVEELGGMLEVVSKTGKGTLVKVILPHKVPR